MSSPYLRSTVPADRTTWLDYSTWKPIASFERSLDLFGDGSLYIVDAAGHLQGHINILVRTSPDGRWAFLAGDSAHDARLLSGDKQIGHYPGDDGKLTCIHVDEEKAADHIRRIAQLPDNVKVCLAHNPNWKVDFDSL